MIINLRPITNDNWLVCVDLQPTEEQMRASFVSSNAFSLAQAHYEPWWEPVWAMRGKIVWCYRVKKW